MIVVYDVETLPNCFTFTAVDVKTDEWYVFEISERKNDLVAFLQFLDDCVKFKYTMVGFNNIAFDYPVIFGIYALGHTTPAQIYDHAQYLIQCSNQKFYPNGKYDVVIPQLDLRLIHHFDNKSRMVGLKQLEFVMRMDEVMEMPFPHNKPITIENIPVLLGYNKNDVLATLKFYIASLDKIELRQELAQLYSKEFMNYSDSKMGKQIIIRELKKNKIYCYDTKGNAKQTPRPNGIKVSNILLPEIQFRSHAFSKVLQDFQKVKVFQTKGVNLGISATVKGVDFDFGFGGIHASVKRKIYRSNETHVIIDADVTSYYPNMSIRHRFYPEHLGAEFLPVYNAIYEIRAEHKKFKRKKLSEAFKLGLNSVYGDSNEPFSPFYDPQMTMSITINGQLFIAMLCEKLLWNPDFEVIQANTDGVTFYVPRNRLDEYYRICDEWQKTTKLELEYVEYKSMHVRDVNNYIAKSVEGEVKLKGAYDYKKDWHKDHSFLVVQKAAVANLQDGTDIAEFIRNHEDIFDFMGYVKIPRHSHVVVNNLEYRSGVRYVISKTGHQMIKKMPRTAPTGKKAAFLAASSDMFAGMKRPINNLKESRINAGNLVTVVNKVGDSVLDINHDFYIHEAKKLVEVFSGA